MEMKGDPTLAPTRPLGGEGETRAPKNSPTVATSGLRAAQERPESGQEQPKSGQERPESGRDRPRGPLKGLFPLS